MKTNIFSQKHRYIAYRFLSVLITSCDHTKIVLTTVMAFTEKTKYKDELLRIVITDTGII
jgi:hypothetical protein